MGVFFVVSIFGLDKLKRKKDTRVHHQKYCTTGNVKGNLSSKKKVIPDGNKIHRGMKSTGNGDYLGKYIKFFYLSALKDN